MKKYDGLNCILLIDDDDATNFVNKLIIQRASVDTEIKACTSAQEGLEYLTCTGKYESEDRFPQPGIIFLDINMPGMNGWEFLDEYKKLPDDQKAKIVVAMLTTSMNPDDQALGESNSSVESFMHKPLRENMLFEIIENNFKSL